MNTASRRLPLWVGLGVAALVVVLVRRAPGVSSLLLGGFIVAYVCAPAVDLVARRLPRALATALIMLGVALVAASMLLMLVPVLVNQWQHLSARLPQALDALQRLVPWLETRFGIDIPETGAALAEQLRALLATSGSRIAGAVGQFAGRTFGGVAGVLGTVINFAVLVPMFAFYLLLNYHEMWPGVAALVPPRHRRRAEEIRTEIDAALGGFVRGQLTVAAILGALQAVGFSIVGIDGAIVLGLLNGLLNMIPLVGAIVGYSLAILVAVLQFGGWTPIAGVVVVLVVAALLEQMVVTPRIIGDRVGLPPLAVMLAVLGGGELFGFVGMLLAVPGAAVVKVLLGHARQSYVASEGYTEGMRRPNEEFRRGPRPRRRRRGPRPPGGPPGAPPGRTPPPGPVDRPPA
jgi:predicted PurR-regulated permease PerM